MGYYLGQKWPIEGGKRGGMDRVRRRRNGGNKDEEEGKNHKREMQSLIVVSEDR